jgi:chemotaxis protein MotB
MKHFSASRAVFLAALAPVALMSTGCTDNSRTLAHRDLEIQALNEHIADLQANNSDLQSQLASKPQPVQDDSQKVNDELGRFGSAHFRNGELIIAIPNEILFASGKASLNSGAKSGLRKVATIINRDYSGHYVRVEGHSDSDPIKRSKWRDNWQLSGERAQSVLRGLIAEGLDNQLASFAGYAGSRPIADNSSRSGKAKNRRVEVVILPKDA